MKKHPPSLTLSDTLACLYASMHEWRNDPTCTKMATESQLRGQRSQKEPGATSLTHDFTSGSSLPRRYLKHMCELVDLFAGDGRRKKTFISMAGWFFFIIHFFSLSTARRPVWWPVTRVNVFFVFFLIATLDCRETLKTSLNPRQNWRVAVWGVASRTVTVLWGRPSESANPVLLSGLSL